MLLIAPQTSLSKNYASQLPGWNAILFLCFVLFLAVRLALWRLSSGSCSEDPTRSPGIEPGALREADLVRELAKSNMI